MISSASCHAWRSRSAWPHFGMTARRCKLTRHRRSWAVWTETFPSASCKCRSSDPIEWIEAGAILFSRRHLAETKSSPGRLAAARGELAQSPGRLAGRGDFSEYQDCSTVRALCRRASERVGCGGGFSRRNCNPSLQIHTIQPVISFAILPPCHNDPLQYSTYGNLQIPVPANESPSPQTVGS